MDMYSKVGNHLVINREQAEKLFAMLGCVNASKWDADVLVQRLRRIAVFCDADLHVGEYQPVIDAIISIGPSGGIILRNDAEQKAAPVPLDEIDFTSPKGRSKNKRHKRKRGEPFSFDKCKIPRGAVLTLKRNPAVTCTVVGDPWVVDFGDGIVESFTARTKQLLGAKDSTFLSPMHYWMYNDKLLRFYYKKYQSEKT